MMTNYDLWVDFMRMQDDGRLRTRLRHARPGFVPIAGTYVIVGSEDADAAVAKILSVDAEGGIRCRSCRARWTNTEPA